ncbi:MAG TPA: S53 family peptidase [Pirellulales bacterium]|jgi:subtilase family serine protease|nr:S53 family peptidase [Pirellulales bacterium]
MESLEPRSMLSANAILVQPNVQGVLTPLTTAASVSVYTPAQIRAAYGFTGVSETGAGQTIAIVDAYGDPTISADLHAFDQQFGLADPKLSVVNETGGSSLPAANSGWDMEISLDVEWAHAIAPGANILLVEASSANLSDLLTAVNYARNAAGVSVVSMSWGTSDFTGEAAYNSYFTTPAGHTPVTFVASSGDSGAGASWPAIANNVLAVGGTTLKVTSSGGYTSESAWSGSGGGYSSNETEASYLTSLQSTGKQSDPDVSYDADPSTGFYVRDGGNWYDVGGTSAGAPQWSALIALANQGRAAKGEAALSNADQSLFSLPSSDFHDITTGSNGSYKATAGYDVVTGRGTPIANLIVNGLIAAANPTTATSSSTTTLAAKVATNAVDGGGATAAGPTGSDSGTSASTSGANVSTTASVSTATNSDVGMSSNTSISTANAAITRSSLGGDSPFVESAGEDQSVAGDAIGVGENEVFGDLPEANFASQFAIDADASPSSMHLHDAIENLLGVLVANEA